MSTKRKRKLAPSHKPQSVKPNRAWYYESRQGIELVTQKRTLPSNTNPIGDFISGDMTKIPWSKLMRSAARCGWKVSKIKSLRASSEGREKE